MNFDKPLATPSSVSTFPLSLIADDQLQQLQKLLEILPVVPELGRLNATMEVQASGFVQWAAANPARSGRKQR